MPSIEQIKASDGSGNANVATVQSSRSSGASTIVVDTVLGINPGGFAGTMGTPHTFTDPITSEEITVISEATAVDFIGHVDGSNLEIDTIAPGYTDNGSTVGDIVIIRPTTQWADLVAAILEVALNDDGTLKSDIVTTAKILNSNVTTAKLADENVTFAKLLSTIFSGQVISAANAGSAGGTNNYINLGGIKLLWGTSNTVSLSGAAPQTATFSTNFPTFFNTIQAAIATPNGTAAGTNFLAIGSIAPATTSGWSIQLISTAGGGGSTKISWLVIGT